jgi:hypothetical protein
MRRFVIPGLVVDPEPDADNESDSSPCHHEPAARTADAQ